MFRRLLARAALVCGASLACAPAAGAQNVWARVAKIDTVTVDYWPPSLRRTAQGPIAVWLRLAHDNGMRMVRHVLVFCGKEGVQFKPLAADLYDQTGSFVLSTGNVVLPWSMAEGEFVRERIGLYVCRYLVARTVPGDPLWRVTPAAPPPRWREFYRDQRQALKLDVRSIVRTDTVVTAWARWEFTPPAPTAGGPATAYVYRYEAYCPSRRMRMRSFAAYDTTGTAIPALARDQLDGEPTEPTPASSADRIRRAMCEESLAPWSPPESPWGPPPT